MDELSAEEVLFPLYFEQDILTKISDIIPSDTNINYDLRDLTNDEIYTLERYAMYTFDWSLWANYFHAIRYIASNLNILYKKLANPSNQLIICPGDSPSRYI